MTGPKEVSAPKWARVAAAAVAVFYLATSAGAFVDPELFFREIGPFPPYNKHFLRDLGAFGIGVGLAALVAAARRAGDAAVMAAVAATSVLHLLSHAIDVGDSGHAARDLPLLAVVLAASATAAFGMRSRHPRE